MLKLLKLLKNSKKTAKKCYNKLESHFQKGNFTKTVGARVDEYVDCTIKRTLMQI